MKYNYIEVSGYERIAVSGHDFVRIDFVNKVQLLLGTNGSGKSSLMKEISVLPSTASEYAVGGYKEVGVSHKGHEYVIRSDFTKGARHSFVKDGEELNPGGTATVARSLALQEFGITPEIHNINCGITNFHSMDVETRRKWFTQIGKEDYTYAMAYFRKLKEHLRETTIYLKQIKNKLFVEKNNLITDEARHELIMDLKLANEALDSVLARKISIDHDEGEMFSAIERQQDEIESICQKVMKLHGQQLNIFSIYSSEGDVHGRVNEIRTRLGAVGLQINQLTEQITKTREILEKFSSLKDTNEEGARERIAHLTAEIKKLSGQLPSEPTIIHERRFYEDLLLKVSAQYAGVSEALGNIVADPDDLYTVGTYEQCIKDVSLINSTLQSISKAQNELLRRKGELEHLKGHGKTKCPQCSHEWHLGYSEKEYQRTLLNLAELEHREKTNKEALNKKQELQELIVHRTNWKRSFVNYIESLNDERLSVKDYITSRCNFSHEPGKAMIYFEEFVHDLKEYVLISAMSEELAEQEKTLTKILEIKSGDIETANKKLQEDEAALVKIVQEQRDLNGELSMLSEFVKAFKLMWQWIEEAQDLYGQVNVLNDRLVLVQEQKILNNLIRELRLKISGIELRLNDAKNQDQVIAKLEKEIEEKTREELLMAEAVKSLSPNEGIIAKSLISFMDQFVNNMNLFIKDVWSYPLEIQPFLKDGDDQELDFKFTVKANHGKPIPDVSLGSTGMRDIFNMAFKIVSLQYSGLTDGPIYLDEFGNALDEKHRVTAQYALLELMQSSDFSQVFMISHDKGSYGNLRNTDVNVLCGRNVAVSDGEVYNVNMRTTK